MKPLKINRTNDAVFKNIFANKKHKAITIDFINSVLEFKGTAQIKDITFIDRELDGKTAGEKEMPKRTSPHGYIISVSRWKQQNPSS